jgi:hypothetical protein
MFPVKPTLDVTPSPWRWSAAMAYFPINRLLIPDFTLFPVKRQFMISSYSPRFRTGTVYDRFFDKCVSVGPGRTRTLAEAEGPGLAVRFYMTLPVRYRRFLLRDLILRIFYDGRDFPSVEVPLGDFFGLPFGRYTSYSSFFLSCVSGGYACRFPMPFLRGMRIELENRSPGTAVMIFFQVNLMELESLDPETPRFQAAFRRENPTREGVPFRMLRREGQGWYVGCNLQVQSLEPFLFRPWKGIPFPQGHGLGMLEGWERVYVDGETEPSFHGSGHEELFDTGWYFTRRKDPGIFSGNLCRSYLTGRAAAYRQHLFDPIPFSSEFRMEIDHGIDGRIRADYAACCYWYEQGDPAPLDPLPAGSLHPSPWAAHAAQFAALPVAGPAGLAAAAPGFLRFLRKVRSRSS